MAYGIVEERGLLDHRDAVESRELFVEIHGEKVKAVGWVGDVHLGFMPRRDGGDGPHLSEAARVAWNEQHRNADLGGRRSRAA